MKRIGTLALFLGSALWAADVKPGRAVTPPAKTPEGITRQQADAILNELKQIRTLLENQQKLLAQRPPAPSGPAEPELVKLKVADEPTLGRADAPVTIVEYTDYQCGFCRQFHLTAFPELKKNYIETGKLRFVSRDLPLEFHGNALRAAQAARCAGEQDRFWEMRDVLVANANDLSADAITRYAQGLLLNMEPFQACVRSGKYQKQVQEQAAQASALDISGTPSFVIGKTTPEGVEGSVLVGAQPFPMFDAKIKSLLARTP